MSAVHRLLIFPLNTLPQNDITVTTVLPRRVYRPYGITREIFPIPAVITVVTTVFPLFPLPCHPLVQMYKTQIAIK